MRVEAYLVYIFNSESESALTESDYAVVVAPYCDRRKGDIVSQFVHGANVACYLSTYANLHGKSRSGSASPAKALLADALYRRRHCAI